MNQFMNIFTMYFDALVFELIHNLIHGKMDLAKLCLSQFLNQFMLKDFKKILN